MDTTNNRQGGKRIASSGDRSQRTRWLSYLKRWASHCASTTRKNQTARRKTETPNAFVSGIFDSNLPLPGNRSLVSMPKNESKWASSRTPGKSWEQKAVEVNDHDYRSLAIGIGIPYGIYDMQANCGTVYVGTSSDTSEFAVDSIEKWWRKEEAKRYPQARAILILADGGGSNGSNRRAWKHYLQESLCNRHHLTITVAHYPPGTSKGNPIEHRLFSEISKNWAGKPLDSYETILNYIRTTKTSTGLRVRSHLVQQQYEKGIKITDEQMNKICITKDTSLPKWN